MLTWVIVVLLNELAVGQKILILNVVNGQTPNVSQLTKNTAQESTDETTTAHERTDEQFLGRQQQGRANKLPNSIQLGKTIMSEVTKKASI